jgi:glyoxylase-like metal-dependent hydrolase (beta-lactamase superfamily II)
MKKQKSRSTNFKSKIQALALFALIFSGISLKAQSNTQVFHIQNYFSEAYLVKNNDKLILIETGVPVPGYADSLVKSIKKLGFTPKNIALAVVTHGHGDHAGNAKFLQEKFHIPIVGSKFDLGKFTSGKTELAKCEDVSIWGTRFRPNMDMSYPPFTPDILVENSEISLRKYGIDGKIIPVKGGHTPGDLMILIGKELFVGDAFIGTFKLQGQGLVPDGHHVREHFYHENRALADKELQLIQKIALDNNVTVIYPTHFGSVTTAALIKYIKEEPALKELSQIQTDMLNEIGKGKTELADKFLSPDYVLQNSEGVQFSKNSFIENYITNPKTKIETISAEDFRIIYADNITAIMTFIENIKLAGKEPKSVFTTTTYIKVNGDWKLVFKQNSNQ